jgi:hypothetical protein
MPRFILAQQADGGEDLPETHLGAPLTNFGKPLQHESGHDS